MAVQAAPRRTDTATRCTRWRVVIYNRHTAKQETYTVHGGKREAEALERQLKEKLRTNEYIPRARRMTFGQVAADFMKQCETRGRRASTKDNYWSTLKLHILPWFEYSMVNAVRRADVTAFVNDMHARGKSKQLIARCVRTLKAVLFYALAQELIERNPLERFEIIGGVDRAKQNRGAFTEEQLRAILDAAEEPARTLFAVLAFTGLRTGEAFALAWQDVDLDRGTIHVRRSWDQQAKNPDGTRGVFVEPKTRNGVRTVALASNLNERLREHRSRSTGEGLVFPNERGRPLGTANVLTRLWYPTLARAGVPKLDLYSLRHTFATFARNAGAADFAVGRAMGHGKSTIVDAVYAHSLPSGQVRLAGQVEEHVLGTKPALRVIEGGKRDDSVQEIRQPLDGGSVASPLTVATR